MQQIIIDKIIVPSIEVTARVVSNPLIKVFSEGNGWEVTTAISTSVLAFSAIVGGLLWVKENIWLNRKHRYKLEPGHAELWIQKNMNEIYEKFVERKILSKLMRKGSIYCFKLINCGTTHDYIYKAEIINDQGKTIDISTGAILKGSDYNYENLPHILMPLQGEVWFLGIENDNFFKIKNPILVIYSGAGTYRFKMSDKMFVTSINE